MAMRPKLRARFRADTRGWTVLRYQFRMLFLDGLQLSQHPIPVGIGYFRLVQNVIKMAMVIELVAKLFSAFCQIGHQRLFYTFEVRRNRTFGLGEAKWVLLTFESDIDAHNDARVIQPAIRSANLKTAVNQNLAFQTKVRVFRVFDGLVDVYV